MSGTKDNKDTKKKDDIKKELNDLLKGYTQPAAVKPIATDRATDAANDTVSDAKSLMDAINGPPPVDFEEQDRKFKDKAKSVIDSMFKFYLDFGVIDMPEYLQRKKEMDTMEVSNIFLQLKMVKTILASLVREITTGNTHPRMYEAYASINSQFSEVIRSQANYILFLEESYKKARFEKNEMSSDNDGAGKLTAGQMHKEIADKSEYYITSDDRSLIKEITEETPISIEEVIPERSEAVRALSGNTHLTDPKNKTNLMVEKNVDATVALGASTDDYESIIDMI